MAGIAICSRCLRAATATVQSTQITRSITKQASTPWMQKHPSRTRRIHHSTRDRIPDLETRRQQVEEIPPYTAGNPNSASGANSHISPPNEPPGILLERDNLFHSFTHSPSPRIRQRAAFMRQNAYCPHPDHRPTRAAFSPSDAESRKTGAVPPAHVRYECPDCGIPVSCSEAHFASDYESHLAICDTLREINEDDHDLVSGRVFSEFDFPGPMLEEAQVNMTNWDTLLYSREFVAVDEERPMRQLTRLLTYPLTVGSVLHELSPYNLKHRLTPEGLRSFSALRYTLHPPKTGAGTTIAGLRPSPPPVRLFILGARAESSLPRDVWLQLSYLFRGSTFHLVFIGPESMANRDDEFPLPPRTPANPFGAITETGLGGLMKISTYVEYFHTLHEAQTFAPYDPYFDAFVLFHPGLGHPASSHEWSATLPQLLETKVPVLCTGYTEFDMRRDIEWVTREARGEMDVLLEPGENRFRSLRWDLNDLDPGDVSCGNWGVWAFRGKRYEADEYRGGGGSV